MTGKCGASIKWLHGRDCHASAWCFLIFARMMLTFFFCRNRKKLHTNRGVLHRISGLLVVTLWMGGEDRRCIFHAMGGTILLRPPTRRAQLPHRTKQLRALGTISVQRVEWAETEENILFSLSKTSSYFITNLFFYCFVNIALHYGFRVGDLSLVLCGFGLGRGC